MEVFTDGLTAETLRRRIAAALDRKVTWLVAGSLDAPEAALSERHPAPAAPADHVALATDGSQIDIDRHGPAHCFLINIGGARLRYGSAPDADLFSQPRLYSGEELAVRDPDGGPREQAIDGTLLAVKRSVMECVALEERLKKADPSVPLVALIDGSLVMWELSGQRYPDFVRAHFLEEGLFPALDQLYEAAQTRPLAFGSYISRPRSTEVVNILRLARCPHQGLETHGCDHFCGTGGVGKKECDEVAQGLADRDLFEERLGPGERSATFISQSPIVKRYGRHRVCFFYVNVGGEMARVELPEWVAWDPAAVSLLHAVVLDQCRKGQGYPVALQEAHERAVVTAADRRYFWELVRATLDAGGGSSGGSLKAQSKRVRAL